VSSALHAHTGAHAGRGHSGIGAAVPRPLCGPARRRRCRRRITLCPTSAVRGPLRQRCRFPKKKPPLRVAALCLATRWRLHGWGELPGLLVSSEAAASRRGSRSLKAANHLCCRMRDCAGRLLALVLIQTPLPLMPLYPWGCQVRLGAAGCSGARCGKRQPQRGASALDAPQVLARLLLSTPKATCAAICLSFRPSIRPSIRLATCWSDSRVGAHCMWLRVAFAFG
jgi:hypothetical protein